MLLVSGANRVDPGLVGLAQELPIYYDPSSLGFKRVWAAAGTPRSVLPIAPADLIRITGAKPLAVTH